MLFAERVPEQRYLDLTHRTTEQTIEGRYESIKPFAAKGGTLKVRAGNNDRVYIDIVDANPLVFNYSLGEQVNTPTADYNAIKAFASGLATMFTGGAAATTRAQPENWDKALSTSGKKTLTINTTVKLPDDLDALAWVAKMFEDIPKKVKDSIDSPTVLLAYPSPDDVKNLSQAERLLTFVEEVANLTLKNTGSVTLGSEGAQSVSIPIEGFNRIHDGDVGRIVTLANRTKDVRTMVELMRKFIADVGAYNRILFGQLRDGKAVPGLAMGYIAADNQSDAKRALKITPNSSYDPSSALKDYQSKHIGDYTLQVSPAQYIHFRPGVGAVYSFVSNPDFKATAQSDGKFAIKRTKNDYNQVSGAVSLNLYPDKFVGQPAEPFFQVGYSSQSGAQGLLAGIGVTTLNANLSAGFIYQQRRLLGDGLKEGDVLAKEEDLKIDKKFKGGFYMQIGVSFGK